MGLVDMGPAISRELVVTRAPLYYDWPSLDVDLPIPSPPAPPFDFLISRREKPDLQRNISKLSAR